MLLLPTADHNELKMRALACLETLATVESKTITENTAQNQ
jgi:hypothetical protein